MEKIKCVRCSVMFDPEETLNAYDEMDYMLYVKKFNGRDIRQKGGCIENLCGQCTRALNDFMYGNKK